MATPPLISQVSITSRTTHTAALEYTAILCLAVLSSIPFIGAQLANGALLVEWKLVL